MKVLKIYENWAEWLSLYADDPELYVQIWQAVMNYAFHGKKPQDKTLWRLIMPMCSNIDRMEEKAAAITEKRKEAGRKGLEARWNKSEKSIANDSKNSKCHFANSKNSTKDIDIDIDTDLDTDIVGEEKEKEKESTAFSSTTTATDPQFSQREEELYNMLQDEHQWIEAIQREMKVQDVQPIIADFRKACVLNGKTDHDNLQDLKQHIYNFSKIRKGIERKTKGGNPLQETLDAIFKTYDHARN